MSMDCFANWRLAYEAKTFTPARFTFNGAVTNLRDLGELSLRRRKTIQTVSL